MKKKLNTADLKLPPLRLTAASRDIVLSGLVCIALIVAAFFWLQQNEKKSVEGLRVNALTSAIADQQRKTLTAYVANLGARVDSASLRLQTLDPDKTNIGGVEQTIAAAFPDALNAMLLHVGTQGIADEDTQTQRLRNNIEIDMLRKSLETRSTIVETYQHNGEWLLSFVRPVNSSAAFFISFGIRETIGHVLSASAGSTVANALIQRYGGRDSTIIAAPPAPNEFEKQHPLPFGLILKVYPRQEMLGQLAGDNTLPWLVCLLCIGLICGSHSIFFLRSLQQPAPLTRPTKIEPPSDPAVELERQIEQELAKKLSAGRQRESTSPTPKFDPTHQMRPPMPDIPERRNKAAPPPPASTEKLRDDDVFDLSDDGDISLDNAAFSGAASAAPPQETVKHNRNCFRAYDIRGIADRDLGDEQCLELGRAIGSEALNRGQGKILLGRDGRISSQRIRDALVKGLLSTGIDVIDLGLIATPMLHYACHDLNIGSGVMVTGSHNPPEYNGLKISLNFSSLTSEDIANLAIRIEQKDFLSGEGTLTGDSIEQRYIDRICSDVVIAQNLRVVIDAGNGATSRVAPELFEELGCDVVPLFCDIDGNFPNRSPDPTIPENLDALANAIIEHGADIGIALDGDGDRIAVVTASGRRPSADQLLMVLADDIISRNPGCDILFDVKCTRSLPQLIVERGGRPVMWKCGHSHMKRKMAHTGALLGGEYSGHIFFNERWYGFDDGMYAAARLIEALTLADTDMDTELDRYPALVSSPEILLPINDEDKFAFINRVAAEHRFTDAKLIDIDGLRFEFRNGWGLIRASNTGPAISLRFEGESVAAMNSIRDAFAELIASIDPALADSL